MHLTKHLKEDENLIFELSIARISFLSLEEKKNLKKIVDSSYNLALLSIEEICNLSGRSFSKRIYWNGCENLHMAQISAYYCKRSNIQILFYYDDLYPEILKEIPNPPYALFCRGNLDCLGNKNISVVGTRKLTPKGKSAAYDFSYEAVKSGFNVISGLAKGSDEFAHKGAIDAFFDAKEQGVELEHYGKTIAVLPGAIDEIIPASNRKLAENILKTGGCLISEYEPGCPVKNWHFVGRNRIIAGLSPYTVVIEAPCGSGALITADFALDFNRDLIFHQAAFDELALKVDEIVKKDLDKKFADGKISKYKRENTPEKFLEAGAPVIKDFYDFCALLVEIPGQRTSFLTDNFGQKELFTLE